MVVRGIILQTNNKKGVSFSSPKIVKKIQQGQAKECGRITQLLLPLPLVSKGFQGAAVTQQMNRFQTSGCQMKEMDIVFLQIPSGLLWVKWFDHNTFVKVSEYFINNLKSKML